jgi:hypothetical protein
VQANREQLLDRYYTHTVHCKACREAYARVLLFQKIAKWAAVSFAAAAMALVASRGHAVPIAVLGSLAAGLAWVQSGLSALARRFVFVDYGPEHPSKK